MNRSTFTIDYTITDKDHLDPADALLMDKALKAAGNAYAPYSGFSVGAAVRLENGEILTGNNQENASFPAGICAERSVIFYAHANFPQSRILSIAITASPCGICRQVLLESEKRAGIPIRVLLANGNEIRIFSSVKDLLPFGFDSF
ncbi:MAG: cytidine deaminase [Bacteroidales bacterium]|jgi:cytidine deaminase|nr:cytidine deaminase [Bacteroidales bacterium]MDD2263765.1 cytidine deaminase [Bacteroidales bacterium]MDD2831017.1 cytidine deaminase [Bacteroidales bacterium]MDD3208175.1 cytidine deaminase [Bacteroidales bacterium]MDD3696783.1 cytidine deaminase [Bacteroidales bacterium]